MNKPYFRLSSTMLVLGGLALLAAACNAGIVTTIQLPAPTSIPATATLAPPTFTPLPPTFTPTPTATPTPGPMDYLLAPADLPDGYELSFFVAREHPDGRYYTVRYFKDGSPKSISLYNAITIAPQPWDKIPPGADGVNGNPVASAFVVGQISQAYTIGDDPLNTAFVFVKGKALVMLRGNDLTLEAAAELAQTLAERLPEVIPEPQPITFPEVLDPALFAQYFQEVTLAKSDDSPLPPGTVFEGEFPCWISEQIARVESYETAVYNLETKTYVHKQSQPFGLEVGRQGHGCLFVLPGRYEFRLAVDGVLVSAIPFEIR